jgi:Tol biopolymer transport system component
MNANGSGKIPLTSAVPGETDYDPSWSPDGSQIAFMATRDGNAEIYTMNSDGSAQTNLTNHPAEDAFPAY